MRTPGHDLELAVGLGVAEGLVQALDDVVEVRHCAGDLRPSDTDVLLSLAEHVRVNPELLGRVAHPSSACGMCGRDRIDALLSMASSRARHVEVPQHVIADLPDGMRRKQVLFRRTGGLHAVALASRDGRLLLVREDVGRHNAVDKVVGAAMLEGMAGDVLVVSGRVGFEIVQKAAMAAIPVIAAVSAPTSLAVESARAVGVTLAAFVRGDRMTVYSGQQRISTSAEPVDESEKARTW